MIKSLLVKVFKTRNERILNKYEQVLVQVNNLEAEVSKYTDDEIKLKSIELRDAVAAKNKQ